MTFRPQPGHDDDAEYQQPQVDDAVIVDLEYAHRQGTVAAVDEEMRRATVSFPNRESVLVPWDRIEVL